MRGLLAVAVLVMGCGAPDLSAGVKLENGEKCNPGEYGWGKCTTPTTLAACEMDGGVRVYQCGSCEQWADGALHCVK